MEKHGIAIVGCGGIATNQHIPAYSKFLDNADVIAACDARAEALSSVKDKFGIRKLYSSVHDLANDDEVDIAAVCTPPDARENVIMPLIEAEKHLLVEKPFTLRLPESKRIVQAAQDKGVKLAVNQNFRWKKVTEKVKELLDSHRIGKDITFMGQSYFVWRDEKRGWRNTISQLEISVYSVHLIDRLRWLCSKRAKSVYCSTVRSPVMSAKGETLSSTTINFEGGPVAQINSSWCARGLHQNEFRIDASDGSILARGDDTILVFHREDDEPQEMNVQPDFNSTFAASMRHLIEAIDEDKEPVHSGLDNLKTMEIVDAAYRSSEEGRAVEIGLS